MNGLLTRVFHPKQQRAHVSSTAAADVWASGGSWTNSQVTESSALTLAAVYACVRVLSESVAGLPLLVYRRTENGKRRAPDHPLYPLLHDLPNPEMTAFELRECLTAHVALWGNAYCEIEWSGSGQVLALWPLRPDSMAVKRERGQVWYEYRMPRGERVKLPSYRVMHLRGLSFDGLIGYSPVRQQMQALALTEAANEFGARFFSNGARPSVVLKYDSKLSPEQRQNLRESWNANYSGLSNSHRTAVLEHGIDIDTVGIPPNEAQFLETRKFQKTEIASIFRVPPHMIADLERATFSNVEQQSLDFVTHSLRPWLVRFEQAIARDLMEEDERRTHFVEHLVDGLLRGDIATRYQAYATGRNGGWLSANDIRRAENMNAIDGGDTYLEPLNMIPVGDEDREDDADVRAFVRGLLGGATREDGNERTSERTNAGPAPVSWETRADDENEDLRVARQRLARSYQHLYVDAAQRATNREVADLRRAADTYLRKRSAAAFLDWLDVFYDNLRGVLPDYYAPAMRALAEQIIGVVEAEIGADVGDADIDAFMAEYLDQFAGRYVSSHHAQAREIVEELDGADGETVAVAIEARIDHWAETEPERNGRDQPFEAVNALAVAAYSAGGVRILRWLASGESCEFCRGLSGQTAGIETYFVFKGGTLAGADGGTFNSSANRRHGPLHGGCDCVVVAA